MDSNLLGLIITLSIYLVALAFVKILPKIDVIQHETHKQVILWYNGRKGERKWVHLFNM